jgi:hypothetical protein
MITQENYEEYALDYLEGNLDANQRQAMEEFLAQHPAIAEDLQGLLEVVLPATTEQAYQRKARLKKKGAAGWWLGAGSLVVLLLLIGLLNWGIKRPTATTLKPLPTLQQSIQAAALEIIEVPTPKVETTPVEKAAELEATAVQPQRQTPIQPTLKNINNNQKNNQPTTNQPTTTIPDSASKQAVLIAVYEDTLGSIKLRHIEPPKPFATSSLAAIELPTVAGDGVPVESIAAQALYEEEILAVNWEPSKREREKFRKRPLRSIKWKAVAKAIVPESFTNIN